MSLAEDTRRAADRHPFLVAALRAGVVNYTAAARFLDVEGEDDAVATALRRYADDLPTYANESRDARVTMHGGVDTLEADDGSIDADATLLSVDGDAIGRGDGRRSTGAHTAIVATGDVDARSLSTALDALAIAEVPVHAAGVAGETLVVVVDRRHGADALRSVESAMDVVPAGVAANP